MYRKMFLPQEFLFTNDINIADVSHIITNSEMANIRIQKGSIFFARNNSFTSDIHYETHLKLKYLNKVSVQS